MNRFEVEGFLATRGTNDIASLLDKMKNDERVDVLHYKGIDTFRLK